MSRNWCFTLNNYTEDEFIFIDQDTSYCAFSFETGTKENTPHLQGFIHFKEKKRLNEVKLRYPRAHLEPMRGSLDQNETYCSKQSELIEIGVKPQQGIRTDWGDAVTMLENGYTIKDIALEHPNIIGQYYKGFDKLSKIIQSYYIPKLIAVEEYFEIPPGTLICRRNEDLSKWNHHKIILLLKDKKYDDWYDEHIFNWENNCEVIMKNGYEFITVAPDFVYYYVED